MREFFNTFFRRGKTFDFATESQKVVANYNKHLRAEVILYDKILAVVHKDLKLEEVCRAEHLHEVVQEILQNIEQEYALFHRTKLVPEDQRQAFLTGLTRTSRQLVSLTTSNSAYPVFFEDATGVVNISEVVPVSASHNARKLSENLDEVRAVIKSHMDFFKGSVRDNC